ncbi:MAG: hypothetical protein LLG06_12245 [Desulfobacteraceae bacterium]|nr:hypothetical protein [Desulfobacteraceae bacterium]
MKIIWVSKNFKRQEADLSGLPEDEIVMMVDLDRCISCGSCQFACRIEHAEGSVGDVGPRSFRAQMKENPQNETCVRLPLSCRHCGTPCAYHDPYNFWVTCPGATPNDGQRCDCCEERFRRGMMPACATRCSMKCIYFGYPGDVVFALNEKRLREMGDVTISLPAEN